MIHVFDTNAFSQIFHSFYRGRFPTLWSNFDRLVEEGLVTSTLVEIDHGAGHQSGLFGGKVGQSAAVSGQPTLYTGQP